uniref:Uncharacterized protein n=1 Tax=Arundo donax TaxID=35708 RepID=A0A0A9GSZ1_ARUDO
MVLINFSMNFTGPHLCIDSQNGWYSAYFLSY